MPGTLYIVATPIGNLADMTPRAVDVLARADMIAAEDTRHSRALLTHFGIRTPSFSCHKFNEGKRGDFFVSALMEGKSVALISDAGTPSISDPGHRLVSLAAAAGVEVVAVCGASAVAAALSVSGFDASRFVFLGFLPRTGKEQTEIWDMLAGAGEGLFSCPAVFYESPLRICKTLERLGEAYPGAKVCLCNDLTKKFERVYRGGPLEVMGELLQNPNAKKGEYTCVVTLPVRGEVEDAAPELSLEAELVDIMARAGCGLKDAAGMLFESRSKRRRPGDKKAIYAATLRLKEMLNREK